MGNREGGQRRDLVVRDLGLETSSQDGSIGGHGSPLHTTTSKLQLKLQQPSLRTIRNEVKQEPQNYRIKEITSIQIGRRDADVKWAIPTTTCGG